MDSGFLPGTPPRTRELRSRWTNGSVFGPSGFFNYAVEACLMLPHWSRISRSQRFKRCSSFCVHPRADSVHGSGTDGSLSHPL